LASMSSGVTGFINAAFGVLFVFFDALAIALICLFHSRKAT
jgi:hypothetical protein